MPHVIVGTAGHIDHGKTALVKALTGIDADRLKEEKERGITIDLGFAHFALDSNTTIGFIDVPGHERFIKNMLAGIGGIDLVMLVIAADESVMPQTREHLDICSLLHIKQGFTVLTKIDKVESEIADLVESEVKEFLTGSFLARSPVLRVGSLTGQGLPELISSLKDFVARAGPKDVNDIFRLPVDRCFTMKGFGTVVTGTLIAGRVKKDEEVEILPTRRTARVRGLQVYGHAASEALAGQRTALNLQGVELADVERGMVLTVPRLFKPASMFDCHLELLRSAPNSIETRKRIRFHIGTAELMGYAVLLDQDRLQPGESAFVQIRLEQPTFALPGDRFIIRQYSPMVTIGGGEILDATPVKHRRSDETVVERLRVFKEGSPADRIMAVVDEAGLRTLELSEIAARRGLAPFRVREETNSLEKAGRLRILAANPFTVVSAKAFSDAAAATAVAIRRFHDGNPLVQGISREELKARLFGDAPHLLFQAVIEKLVAEKEIAVEHEVIHQSGRKVTLKADEERMRVQLAERFRSLGLQAPSADEVIRALKLDPVTARKIIQLMLKDNTLVKINEELMMDRQALDRLITDVKALKAENPRLGVGEFKNLTGVSRKFAIPLLESWIGSGLQGESGTNGRSCEGGDCMASVLVTGSGRGIGFATALALGRAGHTVYATMRDPGRSPALAEITEQERLSIRISAMDVDSDISVREGIASVLKAHGPLDVLVNNAGIERTGSVEELDISEVRAVMETNYFGALRCIQAVMPEMRARRSGCIVNVTSVGGRVSSPPLGAYSASKFALEALSEALAQEAKMFNIRVAIVQPGIIDTAMARRIGGEPAASVYPHSRRMAALFALSLERPTQPSVVAEKILEIIGSGEWKLRYPVGPDAEGYLQRRASMTDEQWIERGAADDETWSRSIERMFGRKLT